VTGGRNGRPPAERVADVQAILFDLDGTLIDTVELIRDSFRYATRTVLGHELPDEVTMRNVGQPLAVQFRDMAPDHADELLRVYREYNMRRHDELARPYPGTSETLAELARRGMPMGVVTSKGTQATERGLDLFDLRRWLGVVVTADDVPVHKPDPYPLAFAASGLGSDLGYCMYVGDSPHDMQAAVSGDAIGVAALWGAFEARDLLAPGPAFALERIEDLIALLDGDSAGYALDEWFREAVGPGERMEDS
jgi:pyrophosphatase PpaX